MRIIDVEQGTDEWLKARLGVPTASNYSKVVTSAGKPSAQADKYINELIAQRLTGQLPELFKSDAMERGNELEPQARAYYEFMTGNDVNEVGLILNDVGAGCSPDGLIGDDGGLEIKCPLGTTHVGYLRAGKLPTTYVQQVQGCMYITGRKWWDFVSFHPDMESMIVRVERDEKFIKSLDEELKKMIDEINKQVKKWSKK